MFQSIKDGFAILASINHLLLKRPVLMPPIFFCWIVYGSTIIFFRFKFDWSPYDGNQLFLIIFFIFFFLSFVISVTNFVLLELIEQIENDKTVSITQAVSDTLTKNLMRALPIILTWSTLWFLITCFEVLTTKKKKDKSTAEDDELNAHNVARELANVKDFSFGSLFFSSLKKGVRMLAFLIFPAIAWEDDSTSNSIKKGFLVAKNHWAEFATGFVLTRLLSQIIFFPVGLVFAYTKKKHNVPEYLWTYVIIYIGLAWSYIIYLEVLFTAELYLWDLNWRRICQKNEAEGKPMPLLSEIKRPSILDSFPDLKKTIVKKVES
jgi:hypothetical protein